MSYKCMNYIPTTPTITRIMVAAGLMSTLSPKVYCDDLVEELIVKGAANNRPDTELSADAEALLETAGAVGDPLRAALSLPGITFAGGDLEEPTVRGTGPGDNQYIVDNIPLTYMFHIIGDSVLSPNVIRTFDIHRSAQTAEYSNVNGGVFDIGMRSPKSTPLTGKIDLSQLKSGVLLEGGSGSHAGYFAYRYSMIHMFLSDSEDDTGQDTSTDLPEGYDYSARYQWSGSDNKVVITAIGAEDTESEEPIAGIEPETPLGEEQLKRFNTFGVSWEWDIGPDEVFNITLSNTKSKDNLTTFGVPNEYDHLDEDNTYLRSEYHRKQGRHHTTFGLNADIKNISFNRYKLQSACDVFSHICVPPSQLVNDQIEKTMTRYNAFAENVFEISTRWSVDTGLNLSTDDYIEENHTEFRTGISYTPNDSHRMYGRIGRYHQLPSTRSIYHVSAERDQSAEKSLQALVGHTWHLNENWSLNSEAYYKELSDLFLNNNADGSVTGAEFMLSKTNNGSWYGWTSLSLSKSTRTNQLNQEKVDYKFDVPVSFNTVINIPFSKGWTMGFNYTYQTGANYTPANSITLSGVNPENPSDYTIQYGSINSENLDAYQRLDIRIEKNTQYRFGEVSYYLDVLNLTDSVNISSRQYEIFVTPDGARLAAEDDEGIPQFFALGVSYSF
jgi:hypothetical protein